MVRRIIWVWFALMAIAAGVKAFSGTVTADFAFPYPAQTTLPGVIVNDAGSNPVTKWLDIEVNGVWYKGRTEYTVIGIPSAYHKLFQSSVTVLQAENGAPLTATVEMVGIASGSGRYLTWKYTVVSGSLKF